MSSTVQRFVLTGPHTGKTMAVNGREFIDGVMDFMGSPTEIVTLGNVLSYYGALTKEEAELQALRAARDAAIFHVVNAMPAEQQAEAEAAAEQQADADATAERKALADKAADDLMAAELRAMEKPPVDLTIVPGDSQNGLPTLAEAVGSLDPENDAHWTSNNLPSLESLLVLTGQKSSRADVDAIAEGYTRTKARAARG